MRVLIACEESQIVCIEFRKRGHEAFSCDILPCSGGHPEWHLQGDVLEQLNNGWDMMIAHPPCTYISYAGTSSWNNSGRLELRLDALDFFAKLWLAKIDKVCIENPMGCASPTIAKYSQIIQPYYFGDEFQKTTCLWTKNLPPLFHAKEPDLFNDEITHVGKGEMTEFKSGCVMPKWYADAFKLPPDERAKIRSKTFPGIARAMSMQWG